MRRLVVLTIILLIGISPFRAPEASADVPAWNTFWDGVAVPVEDAAITSPRDDFIGATIGEQLASYRVTFTNASDDSNAYIPEISNAEFMVVVVDSGTFVLDAKGPGSFLVDPHAEGIADNANSDGKFIPIMDAMVSPDGHDITYSVATDRFVLDENGNPCESLCTVLPGVAVQLTAKDRIIAPAGAICIWCLLQGDVSNQGELFVYPLIKSPADSAFSWATGNPEFREETASRTSGPTGPDTRDAAPVMMGWAFNPSSNCRG